MCLGKEIEAGSGVDGMQRGDRMFAHPPIRQTYVINVTSLKHDASRQVFHFPWLSPH